MAPAYQDSQGTIMNPSSRAWGKGLTFDQTLELTRLQVGDAKNEPVRLCTSTVLEVENLVPVAQEYQAQGRPFNVSQSNNSEL